MESKLEHALSLAAKGFKVFPIAPGQKAPPLLAGWPQRATSDPDTVRDFWIAVPEANIGIHCEGMIVIDVDVKKGGDESLQLLDMTYGLPPTLTSRTPTGGRHLFYRQSSGVNNTVERLAPGLDIRSNGGYVVAVGSVVGAGSYVWGDDVAVADAPEWLVQKLGTYTPREQPAKVNVEDAAAEVVDRARDWLAGQLPAIEGNGGDAHTFKVICGLRDMGVSSVQANVLLESWNATCAPPWTPEELNTKVANAYKYGQNEPGSKAVLPTDFPAVPEAGTIVPKKGIQAAAYRLSEFANSEQKGPGYLVKGLLQRRTYAELFGAPGEGKTFVAFDLAYCVAAGKHWMGRKSHGGPVLYLAYEGIGGLVKRAQALRQKYGDADVPLFIAGAAFNLREQKGRHELRDLLSAVGEKPVLIVIDTLARALMGGDENSAQDVGAFNSAVAALIESTGACVMIIHHSGKNKNAGARGSSALLGAIDTELEVDGGQLVAKKQRDVETGEPIGFVLKPVLVGMDEDGDEVTSCVVEPSTVTRAAKPTGRLRENNKRGFEALCDLSPDNSPVYVEKWQAACGAFITKDLSKRFYDIKRVLVKNGYVVVDDKGMVTRRMG
jgi:RecA/RadA recombinase